jgi:hypothetical protein
MKATLCSPRLVVFRYIVLYHVAGIRELERCARQQHGKVHTGKSFFETTDSFWYSLVQTNTRRVAATSFSLPKFPL